MEEKEIKFKVIKQYNNSNLISYLQSFHLNTSYINNLFTNKKIYVNKELAKKEQIIYYNDEIIINLPIDNIYLYKYNINIIYEDDFIIVVNKPRNILVHTDGINNNTLTNAVNYYLNKVKKEKGCAYPIHRLDYETTGIVIFAKNKLSLSFLSVEIEQHNLEKEYICLCHNLFENTKGTINKNIGKDRHSNKQIVVKTGKVAYTTYEVIKNDKISKVKVNIKHGRKHQIRVHMSYINHPIVGDKLYGYGEEQLKLHFRKVTFTHPYTREKMTIKCREDF